MLKIKNKEIVGLFDKKNNSLNKLLTHGNLDSDKAYELSLIVPELETQLEVINKNRNRLSLKYFPEQENIKDQKELNEYFADVEKNKLFFEDYGKILDKEFVIENASKITLSKEKKENSKSELNLLNLTALDLINLKPLIEIK